MTLVKRSNGAFPVINNIFDDFFGNSFVDMPVISNINGRFSSPAVNIKESDDSFEILMAAPGMKRDDFKIELDRNMLTISSEHEQKNEEKDENNGFSRREFCYGSFRRSFNLPENKADVDKISAKYIDGVLEVVIPKREEVKPKPARLIKIS
ncbi:MAG: Hsp20/alpha crystallin family protein [Bacteroidota bacterium]